MNILCIGNYYYSGIYHFFSYVHEKLYKFSTKTIFLFNDNKLETDTLRRHPETAD